MPDIDNPFTDEDFNQIEKAIADSTKAEIAIKKAQRAGIELPGLLEDNRASRSRLVKIKQTYFPGR